MSASYFTIVHIAVIALILMLSVLFFVLSLKAGRNLFLSLLFTNFLATSCLIVFLMLVLDKYTKIGVLENVTSQRVLRNESIVFKGNVRNVGKFTISSCNLHVKFFSFFSERGKDEKPNTVEYDFNVASDLESKKSVPFTVSMPYPPYFTKGMHVTKLTCY